MCGIGGQLVFRHSDVSINKSDLLKISAAMRSRGPDADGIWESTCHSVSFIHRRLSIIDLSSNGAQPMVFSNESLCITFNGEIYNYRELRTELVGKGRLFKTDSDTEVLLHMYAEYGFDMLDKLCGMFAFAIWDKKKQGVFLARDHLGIKPLYYSDSGKTFRFASQVKALLAGGGVDTSVQSAGHVGFYMWGFVPEPFTLYKGIYALEAGTSLWVGCNGVKKFHNYFNIPSLLEKSDVLTNNKHEIIDSLRMSLVESVQRHLVADVPISLFLSSGVDSVALASLAKDHGVSSLDTITAVFDVYKDTKNDETRQAKKVASDFGFNHHTLTVKQDVQSLGDDIHKMFNSMDQPSIDGVNTYFISKQAANMGVKVALSGLGGDEIFGGYPLFQQIPKMVSILRPTRFIPGLGFSFRWVSSRLFKRYLNPRFQGLMEYGTSESKAYLLLRSVFLPWELPEVLDPDMVRDGWQKLNTIGLLDKMSLNISGMHGKIATFEMCMYMRNQLLRTSDWAGMAHSLEIRVPFVDVKLLKNLAPFLLSPSPINKSHLVEAARIQKYVSSSVDDKVGFNVPISQFSEKFYGIKVTNQTNQYREWAKLVYKHV